MLPLAITVLGLTIERKYSCIGQKVSLPSFFSCFFAFAADLIAYSFIGLLGLYFCSPGERINDVLVENVV